MGSICFYPTQLLEPTTQSGLDRVVLIGLPGLPRPMATRNFPYVYIENNNLRNQRLFGIVNERDSRALIHPMNYISL